MKKVTQTSRRKDEHLKINLEQDVGSGMSTGLENYHFNHQALPELDLAEIDLTTAIMGKSVNIPFFISSMTGGSEETHRINQNLAVAANELNIPMGVGSQRAAIEETTFSDSFNIREFAPNIPLFANLGAVQLNYGYGLDQCQKAVDMISADGLILHLNPLQEALQPEGDTNFSGLIEKIAKINAQLDVPIIIKEVGWGISADTANKLSDTGIEYIDVAGAGGTSWSQIESHRAKERSQREIARIFKIWGIPTAESLININTLELPLTLFASGGLKSGLDAAKCLALGADLCGFAGRIIKSAAESEKKAIAEITQLTTELKITMFSSGIKDISSLKDIELQYR